MYLFLDQILKARGIRESRVRTEASWAITMANAFEELLAA